MKITEGIKAYRNLITIILALTGIGIMMYYDYCDTSCSYLKGDIFGIDLKWVGMAYMGAVIALAIFRQSAFLRALLAAGLGVEVHLYAFQVQNNVYCPFCLAFSVVLIAAFIVNYEVPSAWREKRSRMGLYFLGEVNFPMFKIYKLPLLVVSLLGYVTILLTFSGSVTPAYGQVQQPAVPSLGQGACDVTVFSDYFCPPCRQIDAKAEPLFKELLATGQVRITFVDVPFNRATPVYAKYYLYAANADGGVETILRVRKLLFDAAQVSRIKTESALVDYLKEKAVLWKATDEKAVFPMLTAIIKENKIDTTPTCVIKYAATDIRTFIGTNEIWNGLTALKSHLREPKK
jgi:thiol-disulfide isomerase/thioredoxin